MRGRLAPLLILGLLATGCGSQGNSDLRPRLDFLATTLARAQRQGLAFQISGSLQLTGGAIPAGKMYSLAASGSGELKQDLAQFTYTLAQGKSSVRYRMRFDASRLYVRHPPSSQWHSASLEAATTLFPSLRLTLLRQTTLLATALTGPGLSVSGQGLERTYSVVPASDQVQELQSIFVAPSGLKSFLAGASTKVIVDLSVPAGELTRIAVQLSATDPVSGEHQQVTSTATFRAARVGAISVPADDVAVSPAAILN